MSKFDTHGGHFSPLGYMKVTTGGSHHENPNGGVQLGTDENGIPNLLEEGEPVYNDYVYSDNIVVTDDMVKAHNLPQNIVGKYYSEAADMFIDEASEMTIDHVANNGLNAMLSRLMEAQEEQKQLDEQREIEDELSQLSPEELTQLEAALENQQQPEGIPVEPAEYDSVVPTKNIVPEPVTPEVITPDTLQPVMSCGGTLLRKFADGGIVPPDADEIYAVRDNTRTPFVGSVGFLPYQSLDGIVSYPEYKDMQRKEIVLPDGSLGYVNTLEVSPVVGGPGKGLSKKAVDKIVESAMDKAYKSKKKVWPLLAGGLAGTGVIEAGVHYGPKVWKSVKENVGNPFERYNTDTTIPEEELVLGVNAYPDGGWVNFMNTVNRYLPSRTRGGIDGTYRIDNKFPLGNFKTIGDLENDSTYKAFTDYVLANPNNPNVQDYLHALDNGTADGVAKLFNGDSLVSNWGDLYKARRNDKKGGIYHLYFDPSTLSVKPASTTNGSTSTIYSVPAASPADRFAQARLGLIQPVPEKQPLFTGISRTAADILSKGVDNSGSGSGDSVASNTADWQITHLPTWSRYAGIGVDLASLAYNLAQPRERFVTPEVRAVLPSGTLRVVPQEYRAIDPNINVNALMSQGNATQRAIRNSGAGPSTMAGIVATDRNLTNAIGLAGVQGQSDANIRRNAVIGANNASVAQKAAFDYQVSASRAQILNHAEQLRAHYNMLAQQFERAQDAQEAQAISSQMDAIAQALSNIGRENFVFNQVNSNRALNYGTGLNGVGFLKGV